MEDNPYTKLAQIMTKPKRQRISTHQVFQLGRVISLEEEPLKISSMGLTLSPDDLLLNRDLGNSLINQDQVALLPLEDGQKWLVFCKVVNA